MFRTSRMIAAVTIALWASGAVAQSPQTGGDGTSGPSPAQPSPPAVVPAAPPAAATAPPAAQQGTPATVLDTQDYESLLGRSVRSAGGDELGRVIDVIIDKDGHPRAAIIDFGGFLGVGTRKIAVDWRALRFSAEAGKERKLSVALTRNQVRVSPEYKSGEPIVVLGPASPAAAPAEGEQAAAPAPAQQTGVPGGAPAGPAAPQANTNAPQTAAPQTAAPQTAAPQPAQPGVPEKAPDK